MVYWNFKGTKVMSLGVSHCWLYGSGLMELHVLCMKLVNFRLISLKIAEKLETGFG